MPARTRSVDRTGFDGKTMSVIGVQRSDDGFTAIRSVGPNGNVSARTWMALRPGHRTAPERWMKRGN
jgi:hypothetical protein